MSATALPSRVLSSPTAALPHGSGAAIDIDQIVKKFAGPGGGSTAVDHVSLKVESGELFFLLGPSGCGKTTLLRMIAGFIEPTDGRIAFTDAQGRADVTHLPPNKRNTGMVFQSYALWPHMTVFQNVAFGLEVRKISADERKKRVMEALGAVRMSEYAERKPNQLSGGQQQRIALARAMVIRPSVLLLDEPLSNLDAKLRIELRSEIRRVCKASGMTTVYVTHDQKEALSMADRVAIMRAGKVVQIGTPEDLYRRPRNRFVAEFLGETNIIPAKVVRVEHGLTSLETPSGVLTSRAPLPPGAAEGSDVLISIRPETIALTGAGASNALSAELIDTVYLGEVAQHTLALNGGVTLRMAVLNPTERRAGRGTGVFARIAPEDTVILPAAE
jgi:iron(III) transport system ATP-binding protein